MKKHPIVLSKTLPFSGDVFALYRQLAKTSPSVLLESSRIVRSQGRYSVIGLQPFLRFSSSCDAAALVRLQELLRRYTLKKSIETAGHFVAGAIGYISYEAGYHMEPGCFKKNHAPLLLPEIYFLFFDQSIVVDHKKKKLFIYVCDFRDKPNSLRKKSVLERLRSLEAEVKLAMRDTLKVASKNQKVFPGLVRTSVTRSRFISQVRQIKHLIQKGDIFQANLSQRFSFDIHEKPLDIYSKLRHINPSCFFGFLDAGDFQIVCGSPERLLKLENGLLETRPIAGTIRRSSSAKEDSRLSAELLLSAKDKAEHIMLVDLERNDLGRVCQYGSVVTDELMVLEDYSHVKHIVSNVRGKLQKNKTALDALKAFFPGGTITGAPKIRCMQILKEIEPIARGPYTGSMGYLDFSGNMDFNIIIRSLVVKNRKAHLQVGAGIVADSVPEKEYDETLYKAEAVLCAVFGKNNARRYLQSLRFAGKRA